MDEDFQETDTKYLEGQKPTKRIMILILFYYSFI